MHFTLPPSKSIMFPTLEDNNQAIISTSWMIVLSIIPSDLVQTGSILLGTLIFVMKVTHHFCPHTLIQTLQLWLLSLEEKLQNTIDSRIMAQSDEIFMVQIKRNMGRSIPMSFRVSVIYICHDAFLVGFNTGSLSFKRGCFWCLGGIYRR